MSLTLYKVIAWRMVSIIIGTFVTILYTGNVNKAVTLVLLLTVILTGVHYIFERLWETLIIGTNNGKQ
jgi:uncharacterized membrane protein